MTILDVESYERWAGAIFAQVIGALCGVADEAAFRDRPDERPAIVARAANQVRKIHGNVASEQWEATATTILEQMQPAPIENVLPTDLDQLESGPCGMDD